MLQFIVDIVSWIWMDSYLIVMHLAIFHSLSFFFIDFFYDGSHGDQICDAASKTL